MKVNDVLKWNKRVSAAYALGIWSMIASYAFFKYTGRYDDRKETKEEEVQEHEDLNQVVHQTTHTKSVLVYKKDFVPYTTRIYNFFTSISSDHQTGGDEK